MRWRLMGVACVMLGLCAAAESEQAVAVTTREGQTVTGTVAIGSFTLQTSLGAIPINLSDIQTITLADGRATVRMTDGTTLKGTIGLATWNVRVEGVEGKEIEIPADRVESITVLPGLPKPAAMPPPKPAPAPASKRPALPPGLVPLDPPLIPPLAALRIRDALSRLTLSTDGKALFALAPPDERAGLRILRLAPSTLDVEGEFPLPAGAGHYFTLGRGDVVWVAGGNTLYGMDCRSGKILHSVGLAIGSGPFDLCLLDEKTAYASTERDLFEITLPAGTVVRKIPGVGGVIYPAPDRTCLYLSRGGKATLARRGNAAPGGGPVTSPYATLNELPPLRFTPDGRCAVLTTGRILRLGRSVLSDLLPCAEVEPHRASLFLPAAGRMLLFTEAGTVKEYDAATFEPMRSVNVGVRAFEAVADEGAQRLYVFGQTGPALDSPEAVARQYQRSDQYGRSVALFAFPLPLP